MRRAGAGILGWLLASGMAAAAPPDPGELLRRVSGTWGPVKAVLQATLTTERPEREPVVTELRILRGGEGRTRIEFLSPEEQRGKVLLQLQGETWMYLPGAGRLVEVPLRRNPLSGSVLFEDLVPESLEGQDASVEEHEDGYVLVLEGTVRRSGTDRIYFHRDTLLPFRREFRSRSGRLLRTLHIEETRPWKGIAIPWRVRFVDHLRGDLEATLIIQQAAELPGDREDLFRKESLAATAGPGG